MDLSQAESIAKGKILGYLLMSKNPLSLNMVQLCDRLQLTPALATHALKELEAENRLELTISRAVVVLLPEKHNMEFDFPPSTSTDVVIDDPNVSLLDAKESEEDATTVGRIKTSRKRES